MNILFNLSLLSLLISAAWFDGRKSRIPNPLTYLLIICGLILNFPGTWPVWMLTTLLMASWYLGGMGGGDLKLWLALIWLTPPIDIFQGAVVFGLCFSGTGLLQLFLRRTRKQYILGVRSPGAWRALPYAVWLVVA